jgi:hypothetical protein
MEARYGRTVRDHHHLRARRGGSMRVSRSDDRGPLERRDSFSAVIFLTRNSRSTRIAPSGALAFNAASRDEHYWERTLGIFLLASRAVSPKKSGLVALKDYLKVVSACSAYSAFSASKNRRAHRAPEVRGASTAIEQLGRGERGIRGERGTRGLLREARWCSTQRARTNDLGNRRS